MAASSQSVVKLKNDTEINGKTTGVNTIDQFGIDFLINDIFIEPTEITGLLLLGPTISIGTNEDANNIMSAVLPSTSILVVDNIVSLLGLGAAIKNHRVPQETNVLCKVASAASATTFKFNVIVTGTFDEI